MAFPSLLPWLSGSLEVLFPRECLVCTRPLRGASLCFRCTPRLPDLPLLTARCCRHCFSGLPGSAAGPCEACLTFPLLFRHSRHLWDYSFLARDLIRAIKYRPSRLLARAYGETVGSLLAVMFPDPHWDLLVPIPSSAATFRRRLFHPCADLAQGMIPFVPGAELCHALHHARSRAPQATLSHDQRLQGARSILSVRSAARLTNQRVLLVEDVITTGATSASAARALLEAGAASVDIVALARASVWPRFRRRVWKLFARDAAPGTAGL